MVTAAQLLAASILTLPAVPLEDWEHTRWAPLPVTAVVVLAILGTALANVISFVLVRIEGRPRPAWSPTCSR